MIAGKLFELVEKFCQINRKISIFALNESDTIIRVPLDRYKIIVRLYLFGFFLGLVYHP